MVIKIQITIQGDTEVKRYFNSVISNIEPRFLRPFIDDYAEDLKNNMIRNEHSITGTMRAMTKVISVPDGKAVIVDVPYGETENQRPGIKRSKRGTGQGTRHNFVEPSLLQTNRTKEVEFLHRLEVFLRTV